MKDNYIDKIERKTIKNKIFFSISDIKIYLIEDYDDTLNILNRYELSLCIDYSGFVDLYSLVLLILFSRDYRTLLYKKFIIYSTVLKIYEIFNPDSLLDRLNSIKKKNSFDNFSFTRQCNMPSMNDNKLSSLNLVYEEIKFSNQIDVIRQII